MAVWAGLGQVAAVAQLVGVDAGVLISNILQAAATARENKKECEQLAHRVSMIAELLPHLQDPDQAIMRQPLAGLDETLREAHELVVSCQRRSAAYRFVMAGRQAGRFRRVQSKIDSCLMVFPVISHIAITRRLDRMHNVQLPNHTRINLPPSPVSQLVHHQVIGAEEFTLSSSHAAPLSTCSLAIDTALGADDTATVRKLAKKRLKIGRRKGEGAFSTEVAAVPTGASQIVPHKHVLRVSRRCVVDIEKRFRLRKEEEGQRELLVKPSNGSERIRSQFKEQARATAETQKQNSELSHQVTELQDQLQAEHGNTQERINLDRAKRENLEEMLKEERAERERFLEEERKSRLEFEKNMMAKFGKLTEQMGTQPTQTQQMAKKRTDKENSNPNLQNTFLKTPSTTRTLGTRKNVIAPNTLIQAPTKNS